MSLFVNLIPLVAIIVLLFKRQHMLFAGFVGGVLAIIIGGMDLSTASKMFIGGIGNMLGITVPIIYAAAAAMVSKAGSIQALVEMARRKLKGKISILAGIMVLIQAAATYMAGMGAGNTMVTAPLIAAAVGAVPEVIGAMAIATAAGFTTSPASTETAITAESAGREIVAHASAMMPYTIAFYLIAAGLAVYGVHKRGVLVKTDKQGENDSEQKSSGQLLKEAVPAIALLCMVVGGSKVNALIGVGFFNPATSVIITSILTVILTPLSIDDASNALIDGSRFILTTLFSVGIFLAFINMIAELGTFRQLAALANNVPESIVLPVAICISFLIAIPSGAFTAGVLTLTLPTLSVLGLPSEAMGLVAIATGLGTQVSPVQINVAALAEGFDIDIVDVIKGNLKFVLGALVLLIVIGLVII